MAIDINSTGATCVPHTNLKVETYSQVTAEFNELVPSASLTEMMGAGPCVFVKPLPKSKLISSGAKAPLEVKLEKRRKPEKLKQTTSERKKKSTFASRREVAR